MHAHQELLRVALQDEKNTKFVFLSESTIPLKSFAYVYDYLRKTPQSFFDFCQETHNYRKYGNVKIEDVYKNSQWVVLNRKHAMLFVQDEETIATMTSGGHLSFSEEHYPSTYLGLCGLHHEVDKEECTFVIWPPGGGAHPYIFEEITDDAYSTQLREAARKPGVLFSRKFSSTCDVYTFVLEVSQEFSTVEKVPAIEEEIEITC